MLTRAHLASLPLATLTQLADAALKAASLRWSLPPVRAAGLPRRVMVEIAHTAQVRATLEHGRTDHPDAAPAP